MHGINMYLYNNLCIYDFNCPMRYYMYVVLWSNNKNNKVCIVCFDLWEIMRFACKDTKTFAGQVIEIVRNLWICNLWSRRFMNPRKQCYLYTAKYWNCSVEGRYTHVHTFKNISHEPIYYSTISVLMGLIK